MSFKPYSKIIIRDANLVNEGKQEFVDVLIQDGRIEKIAPSISHVVNAKTLINFNKPFACFKAFKDPS